LLVKTFNCRARINVVRTIIQLALVSSASPLHAAPPQLSGIYPSLAYFNNEGECGTGAVVPWADRLWVVTYAPHSPKGSSDKLYEITPDLEQIIRPESIGGTPANRMIHDESQQLFIGPYVIDANRKVRTIPYSQMFGRPTANARHLTDPAAKIYYATMEEGIYEVDVKSLAVTELFRDEQLPGGHKADLPGYHGKGLYSGQGQLVYANNGDHAAAARTHPEAPSGVLAEWDGSAEDFTVVRRNQFTDVTGPGGIHGNANPDRDPVWAMGWDHRSLILMLLDGGKWQAYRLPKGSHSYDGAHGWNTEWPRIREIGEGDKLLATMHGTFWAFPKTFSAHNTAGIVPRSNYLKVIGDFARWNDRVVFGCDDTAKNEFLNKSKTKGNIAAPQSQSNLWFVAPDQLDKLGPVIGRGAVWMNDPVTHDKPSDPFLIDGYGRKGLHLAREIDGDSKPPVIRVEVDEAGNGTWKTIREIDFKDAYQWIDLTNVKGVWLRLTSGADLKNATAFFQFSNADSRGDAPDAIFKGLAASGAKGLTGGLVRALGENRRTLALSAVDADGKDVGAYELGADLSLKPSEDSKLPASMKSDTRIPVGFMKTDAASVVFSADDGKRWRLPIGGASAESPWDASRAEREVATERNLFNASGTFYELPAVNAGGFAKIRPVATHNLGIHDYCSYRGLFIMTGIRSEDAGENPHIIRSADGKAALWAGAIDDVWKMGKPRGHGGPWMNTSVGASEVSDPYLLTGYDKKSLAITSDKTTTINAEIDLTGSDDWVIYKAFEVKPGATVNYQFPEAFSAYWIRFTSSQPATVTAQLEYR